MYAVPEVRKRHVQHQPRSHPWHDSGFEGGGSYRDFKAHPELIREILEDFKPHEHQIAVQTFYSFLEYLNGPDSVLESNDCALRAPHGHEDLAFNKAGLTLKIDGRLECLYREDQYNLNFEAYAWLIRRYFYELCFRGTDFREGFIEIGMRPTYFPRLESLPIPNALVSEFISNSGHTDATMLSLGQTSNLSFALSTKHRKTFTRLSD